MALEPAEHNMELVTIVIVNYETSAYANRCVASLRHQNHPWEAVIVDNPSPEHDFTNLQSDPPVRVVRSPENVGYGLGCNLGASYASSSSQYICILNPDTVVPDGQLAKWIAAYKRHCPKGGILGPALHNDNGTVQRSSYEFYSPFNYWLTHSLLAGFLINRKKGSWTGGTGRGFKSAPAAKNPVNSGEKSSSLSPAVFGESKPQHVGWLMGAALLMNRDTWHKLHGFSDHYFLYSEDTDLCWRCQQVALPVLYDSTIRIIHTQGDPPAGAARERGIIRLFDGMKRFVDQNYSGLRLTGMYFVVTLDMIMRLAVMLPLQLIRRNDLLLQSRIRGYTQVLRQWLNLS